MTRGASIRRAVAGDAPALAELAERTFRDAFAAFNRTDVQRDVVVWRALAGR